MTLQLKVEDEQIIARGVYAGVISGAQDVVQLGVEVVRQRLTAHATTFESSDGGEWSADLRRWIDSHKNTGPLLSDDAISRDSIYDTRDV